MPELIYECHEKCGTTPDLIRAFELSTDFDNLPDSKELKCCMYCGTAGRQLLNADETDFDFSGMFDVMSQMDDKEQDIYIKGFRGCFKQDRRIKDMTERIYKMYTCMKRNDNKVNIGKYV